MKRPEESLAGMIDALQEKTGKTLDAWKAVIDQTPHMKHGEIMAFLKGEHGVSHGYANQIALRVREAREGATASEGSEADPVDALFVGSKAASRPLYDTVLSMIQEFGPDIDLGPKKAYVSVRRRKQFAILQPASGRLDVGINFKARTAEGRLEPSGSFNAMLSHRVKVTALSEIDDQLRSWLFAAYEEA